MAATAIDGASADQVIELVRQLHVDRLHAWIALDGQPVDEPASATRYTPCCTSSDRRLCAHSGQEDLLDNR
jgi:hypothetical protein